jgi:Trypsin
MNGYGRSRCEGKPRAAVVSVLLLVGTILVLLPAMEAQAITNGQPDGTQHPYAGMVFDVGDDGSVAACSGVLVSPRVFLTAGHCTETFLSPPTTFNVSVSFAPDATGLVAQATGTPHTYPGFCPGCGGAWGRNLGDLGVIVLDAPVTMAQYGLLPSAGADAAVVGAPLTLVGYGMRSGADGCAFFRCLPGDFGVRAMTTGVGVAAGSLSDTFIKVNAAGTACFGDSGGPVMAGGGPTVLALDAFVADWSCMGLSYATRIDNSAMLSWIGSWM